MLRRYLTVFQSHLKNEKRVSPTQLKRLRHYWSNDDWSAGTEFLEGMLRWLPQTTGNILECGSGLTTLLLGAATSGTERRTASLEHNPDWAARVRGALPQGSDARLQIVQAPITSYDEFDWYSTRRIDELGPVGFVVCDGPPGSTRGGRYGLAPVVRHVLAPGCIVMLDDASRPEEQAIIARWLRELPAVIVEETQRYCVMRVGAR
jgi:hypothetical protein